MLPTESLGWNGLQALKSRLSGRLSKFTRRRTDSRPRKTQNDATFFDADLRYIFTTATLVEDLSKSDYHDMDEIAKNLLESLNGMVNRDIIAHLEEPLSQTLQSSQTKLPKNVHDGDHDIAILGDRYPCLNALIRLLDTSTDQFNLATGDESLLFQLPEGEPGRLAVERIAQWKTFLARFATTARTSRNFSVLSRHEENVFVNQTTRNDSSISQPRAGIVLSTIFKGILQDRCGRTHELRLKVSDEWQAAPSRHALDLLLSCCHGESDWQEAKCGSFPLAGEEIQESSICAAIQRAHQQGRKLYLFVDHEGLLDISEEIEPSPSSLDALVMESLEELFGQQSFTRITAKDYLGGTAMKKFSCREKAAIALALARCLLEFFDEDLELASYSWKPESVHVVRSSSSYPDAPLLYLSLRPASPSPRSFDLLKTVGPGNPILLSFARLLLEIDNGEKIPIEIYPQSQFNVQKWGEMCGFVNVAEREGSSNYLRAVEGCLYLHMALPKSGQEPATADATREIVREAIYEQVVRNLELVVNPQSSKRKRQDSMWDIQLTKKVSISSTPSSAVDLGEMLAPAARNLHTKEQSRPATRSGFDIAIVCALRVEYDAVTLVVDEFWDEDRSYYGKAEGDPNVYTTGRIGSVSVVLVLLPNMGKVSAARTSASLALSYPALRFVLLAGICGGVPYPEEGEELLLGDVVISQHIVQYDLGRKYPDDFRVRNTVHDSLGRAPRSIRNLLALLDTAREREQLEERTAIYLQQIQAHASQKPRGPKYRYPGASRDKLFQPNYLHEPHSATQSLSPKNRGTSAHTYQNSRHNNMSCEALGCDAQYLVRRERLELKKQLEREGHGKEAQAPSIFVGPIGSGDTLFKSGEDRDMIAMDYGIMAFEMEGAGVWDDVPCIVVKAVCDYADSHKNKAWQSFAAASAASATKAVIERYIQRDHAPRSRSEDNICVGAT